MRAHKVADSVRRPRAFPDELQHTAIGPCHEPEQAGNDLLYVLKGN
jgi:hypothetical protein